MIITLKLWVPEFPHAIVKELCNTLDISISHEYASISPHYGYESWLPESFAIPPKLYKKSEALVRLDSR